MLFRQVTQLGEALNIAGGSLTTSYQNGTPFALQGTHELDAELLATFKSATSLTSQTFRIAVADDPTLAAALWEPVATDLASSGAEAVEHALNASAGNTVKDRISTKRHRHAKYAVVQVKIAGTPGTGDIAQANLNFSE